MNKTVSIIIILVVLGGIAWYMTANYNKNIPTDGAPGTTDTSQTQQDQATQPTDQTQGTAGTTDTTTGTTGTGTTTTNPNTNTNSMDNKLKIEVLTQGTGPAAKTGDTVEVTYVGTLTNGTKFDASADHGAPGTFSFTLGENRVIKGWEQGVLGMKVGEKIKLTIPPELGYGSIPNGAIPANSTLVFEVGLVSINKAK